MSRYQITGIIYIHRERQRERDTASVLLTSPTQPTPKNVSEQHARVFPISGLEQEYCLREPYPCNELQARLTGGCNTTTPADSSRREKEAHLLVWARHLSKQTARNNHPPREGSCVGMDTSPVQTACRRQSCRACYMVRGGGGE